MFQFRKNKIKNDECGKLFFLNCINYFNFKFNSNSKTIK